MYYNNPLMNKEFLKQLDNEKNKTIYAKIVALNFNELPIKEILGLVTAGNVNVDGSSAVRRSCSLTLIANINPQTTTPTDLNDFYWGLNTKFKLYIGVKNEINSAYDDIIWFNLGLYLITSFSASLNTDNFSISISGKDKMCLLNGDVGGIIPVENCFGVLDEYDEEANETITTDLPIKQIIKEAVHFYGKEPYHNIIINDLDDAGKELLEYEGTDTIYLISKHNAQGQNEYYDFRKGTDKCYIFDKKQTCIQDLEEYDTLNEGLDTELKTNNPTHFWFSNEISSETYYTALQVPYGTTIGYRQTDLTYPDAENLVIKAGENVNTLLDKIVKTFGDYEYFYNVDGLFVFQKKKTYLNTSFNNLVTDEETGIVYGDSAANTSAITYSFEDSNLVTSFSNSPDFSNLKNDYVCWGKKTSETGTELDIHMRYAIDTKPNYYHSIDVNEQDLLSSILKITKTQKGRPYFTQNYYDSLSETEKKSIEYKPYDWREIIYQMAHDYYQYGTLDNFLNKIISANKTENLYTDGTTGYEQYYLDLLGFWRQLYDPNLSFDYVSTTPTTTNTEELFITDNYRKVEDKNDLKNNFGKYPVYIARTINNISFLTPLIDSVALDYEEVGDTLKPSGNFTTSLYVDNSSGIKTLVKTLNGIKKSDLYLYVKKNTYEKLDSYLVLYSPAWETSYCVYIEESNPTTLQAAVEAGKVYFKLDDDYINPLKYFTTDKFLYSLYCNTPTSNALSEILEKLDFSDMSELGSLYKTAITSYELDLNGATAKKYLSVTTGIKEPKAIETKISYNKKLYSYFTEGINLYWNKTVVYNPSLLLFWFDMLSTTGELNKYSVSAIGDRLKVDSNSSVKAIYYEDIPNIIFHSPDEYLNLTSLEDSSGYLHLWLSDDLNEYMVLSGLGTSAKDDIDDLIYNYTHCNETISLTTIPVYYLEPNTRIFVNDITSGIKGEYIINKMTILLTYNGTMSISAIKATERLI